MSKQVFAAQLAIIKQMSGQVSRGSAGDYQADELAGVPGLSWRFSSRRAGTFGAAHLAMIKQMSGQVSCGSAGDYQADEQARSSGSAGDYQPHERTGVEGLSCRLSGR